MHPKERLEEHIPWKLKFQDQIFKIKQDSEVERKNVGVLTNMIKIIKLLVDMYEKKGDIPTRIDKNKKEK